MPRRRLAGLAALLLASACADNSTLTQPGGGSIPPGPSQDTPGHIMTPNGSPRTGRIVPLMFGAPMTYQGGQILPATKVAAIYWASSAIYSGGPTPGTACTSASDGSVVGYFLRNLGGSTYFNINTTYYDRAESVQNSVTYSQCWASNGNVPPSDGTPVSNATIQNQIVSGFNSGNLVYDASTVYAVFTAGNTNLGGKFGYPGSQGGYCAYHNYFTWNSKTVIFAAMPFAHQYGGCTSGYPAPNGDPAADQEVNVLAHEIEESTTDFKLNAWYDGGTGNENADMCAWVWGSTNTLPNGGVWNVVLGAKNFLIQENWSRFGVGGCSQGLGQGIAASGGLVGNCGVLCNTPAITSIIAAGSTITIKDNGGHTATMTLSGATATGGLTASCGQLCSGGHIGSISSTGGNTIALTDVNNHTGTITLSGATASGAFAGSCGVTCGNPGISSMTATGHNSIRLTDSFGHVDYVFLAP